MWQSNVRELLNIRPLPVISVLISLEIGLSRVKQQWNSRATIIVCYMPQKLLYEKIADSYRLLRAFKLSDFFSSYRTDFSIYLLMKITSFQRYQQSNIFFWNQNICRVHKWTVNNVNIYHKGPVCVILQCCFPSHNFVSSAWHYCRDILRR